VGLGVIAAVAAPVVLIDPRESEDGRGPAPQLVAGGLVSRTIYAEVPPRVEYALTERASSFA
jgi:hypothetical protein